MSLIVGQYYRGNPKQKPKQWGSYNGVQSVLKNRLENAGIPTPVFYYPFWEMAGKFRDIISGLHGGDFSGELGWEENGVHVSNISTPGYSTLNNSFSASDNTPWTIALTFKSKSNNQTKVILAGYNNSVSYGYLARYPGSKFRIRFVTAIDFTTITNFYNVTTIIITCNGSKTNNITAYQDGVLKDVKTSASTAFDLNMIGTSNTTYTAENDIIYQLSAWDSCLTYSQVSLFSNNVFYYIQPPTFRTYFDLSTEPPAESWPKQRTLTGPFWGPFGGI